MKTSRDDDEEMDVKVGLDKVKIQNIRFTTICEYTSSKKIDLRALETNVEDEGLVLIYRRSGRKEVKTSRDDDEEMEVKVGLDKVEIQYIRFTMICEYTS